MANRMVIGVDSRVMKLTHDVVRNDCLHRRGSNFSGISVAVVNDRDNLFSRVWNILFLCHDWYVCRNCEIGAVRHQWL